MARWPVSPPSCSRACIRWLVPTARSRGCSPRAPSVSGFMQTFPRPTGRAAPRPQSICGGGPPFPLTVSWGWRGGLDPVFAQAAQSTNSAACPPQGSVGSPWAAGWGTCSGRGSSQGRPRDPGLEPPSPPKLGTRAPRTGPQQLWTPRAGPALLRTDGPHPHFLLSNKKHSFVPKVGPEVSQSPVSCQA